MNKQLIEQAKLYLLQGLSVLPTCLDRRNPASTIPKTPAVTWSHLQDKPYSIEEVESVFSSSRVLGIGIIGGRVSGGLEVIDVDTKQDKQGTLWEELKTEIQYYNPDLWERLVVASTPSGGYHIYYRCETIQGNEILAKNKEGRTLVETRGEGGLVVAYPTPNYTFIQGNETAIPTITPTERELLWRLSKERTEIEEETIYKPTPSASSPQASWEGWEKYNQEANVIRLLQEEGWEVVGEDSRLVYVKHPSATNPVSGNYHKDYKTLRVFSTGQVLFNPKKAYSASQVFTILKCNGDSKQAYRKLQELGYGERYSTTATTALKTERIRVTSVNSVICERGETLTSSEIKQSEGIELVIHTPLGEAQEETRKAIELVLKNKKRAYIREGENSLPPIRDYRYLLKCILDKYATLQETQEGGLTDQDIDSLLDEVIETASYLPPLDRDLYKKEFLNYPTIQELGISEESLSITIDRLTATKEKEAQREELTKLLAKASRLTEEGKPDQALKLLTTQANEVKLQDKLSEFSRLSAPTTLELVKKTLQEVPKGVYSGYSIEGERITLPSGAVTLVCAPTGHGKTSFLINLALNTSKENSSKEFYFLSYEESAEAILVNTLNTYSELNTKNNREYIRNYLGRKESSKKRDLFAFLEKEANEKLPEVTREFFSTYIENGRLNIQYLDFDSDTLVDYIRYLKKHKNAGGIYIDYIQLLNLPEGKYKYNTRQEELKRICVALKDVAVETGLPIVLGAQFNRDVKSPSDLYPQFIREAGDIEQVANLILGFWNNTHPPAKQDPDKSLDPNTLLVKVLKNREGKVWIKDTLSWNGNTGKIKNQNSFR